MATPLLDRLGLNPRERRLVVIMLVVVATLIVIGIPVGLESLVHVRDSYNQDLYAAIGAVQGARAQVRERQAKKDSIATRYAKHAPALAGFLEQTARQEKLEVTDSVDRPDVPHGKRYVERASVVHLKKAGMYSIAKFLESLEKSGYPIEVSRLNIRRRTGEPDSYDVEVGVSAYDRSEPPPAAATDADSKEKQP
jgi:general secretion pathway protein M